MLDLPRGAGLAVLGCTVALACASPEDLGAHHAKVIYGENDLTHVHAAPDAVFRERAIESSVALVHSERISISGSGTVSFSPARTGGMAAGLCPDEVLASDISQASCTGTLIDHDLVLTAGHCVRNVSSCTGWSFVFDFHEASPGTLAPITHEDVYYCHQLLLSPFDADHSRDYAVIELDRPVRHPDGTPRALAPITATDTARPLESEVVVIGTPLGTPMRIARNGFVAYSRPTVLDIFGYTGDTTPGSSGGGVYDNLGNLVGVHSNSLRPAFADLGCNRIRRLTMTGEIGARAAEAVYVHRAVDDLCATGRKSLSVCGVAPVCGDGQCSGIEDPTSCAADCAAPTCGNGVCDLGELLSCPDCLFIPFEPSVPPPGWTCDSSQYDRGDGCHCACGAPDPDCDDYNLAPFGCGEAEICSPAGACVADPDATTSPSGWTCFAAQYDASDACHCGCGIPDPDCDDASLEVIGCADGDACVAGACETPPAPDDAGPPAPGTDAGAASDGGGAVTDDAGAPPDEMTDGGCRVSRGRSRQSAAPALALLFGLALLGRRRPRARALR